MERAAQAARADAEAAQVEAERQHAQAESRRAEAECQRAEAERLRLVQQQDATRKIKRALMGLAVVTLLALVASVVAVRAKRYADLANIEAQQQAAAAERSAMAEKDSAKRARESAEDANREAKRAAKKEAEAIAAQQALQQQKFSADMTLAQYAYEAGNANEVSRRLLQYVPNDDEQDRRGVEWRLWWNATHLEQRVIHRGGMQIFEIAISPDGKLVADSHGHTHVRLRETANPDKIKSFFVPASGELNRLAFSPDSSMLATVGDYGNHIHRFSTEDASLLGKVEAPVRLRDLSFSPTENQLVSGGDDGRLYFWDTISWDRSDSLVSDDSLPIWSVAYSPDGSRIVAGMDGAGNAEYSVLGFDSPLVLLDSGSRSIRSTARGHTARITSVAWSPNGQLIASGGADATVRVWTKDLSPVGTLDSGSWVTQVAFSPDGKYLAAGTGMDNAIRVWKTDDWEPATTLKGHSKSVTSIAFDPRRGDLWSVSEDTTIKTWSIEQSLGVPGVVLDDEKLRTMLGNAYRTSVAGDGRTLFCCNTDGAIERYDLANQTALPAWKERTLYKRAAFSDDGRIMVTAEESTKLVKAWRLDDEELIAEVPISREDISSLKTLCVARDAKRIGWTAGNPVHLVLVDTESGDREQAPFRLQKSGLRDWTGMSISADAKRLYVKIGFDVRVMEIDDFLTGVEAEPTDIEVGDIALSYSFAFSDDGSLGAAPNFYDRIPLRDLNTERERYMLAGHSGEVRWADFTDDSRRLLSGSEDGTVKIWDVTTGDSLATLRGHAGPVDWVGSRNDDSQIISLSRADGTVRIWNAATEEKIWQNPVNWVELARHHKRANRLANAIAAYDQAVELAPDDPELRSSRIELNSRMGRFAAAMDDYLWRIAMGKARPDEVPRARALPRSSLVDGDLEQPLLWRYTFAHPSGDWTKPGFDDQSWNRGASPFGSSAEDATAWAGDDIWLRCEFDLATTVSDPIVFFADCDDMANFYLNGVHAARGGGGERSQTIPCSEQAAATLKPGRNVLAIHCHNSGGDARIDAGLFIGRTLEHWIDKLTTALDKDPSNVHLLRARARAYREQGDGELAAADEANVLSQLRILVKLELDSPDVAWPTYAPTLADLLILRGEEHAALGQSDEANDDWRSALELDESVLQRSMDRLRRAGKWRAAARLGLYYLEQEPTDRIRWLNVAPLLVMAEDEQGYREFCDAMVKQFSDTTDQTQAENTCRACLLLPDAVDVSKLPVKVFADPLDAGTTRERLRPWAWAARALVAYRSGDSDLASKYLQKGWATKPRQRARALYHAITALKRHRQGDSDGAREDLGKVRRMLDQRLPSAEPSELHNWLIPQILADEAEGLLNDEGESSEAERTNGSN
jgi:WD40 repeat protein